MAGDETVRIFELRDARSVPDPVHPYPESLRNTPLIIDNGSHHCRVGWATDKEPRIIFRNCYAKHRKDRGKKIAAETEILVANDIVNIEAVRFQLKSPHDENVVTHFEAQETMLDYVFSHLGINTSQIDHPVILTEAFCNPNYSRQLMSELLFECYGVPTVSYCVDGLLSYHHNNPSRPDGLLVNIGNCTTHVIPILNGFAEPAHSRRIRMGGSHLTRFLWRWLQLRFPHHLNAITLSRAEEILHHHMYVADDYMDEVARWSVVDHYEQHVRRIQLPFVAAPVSTVSVEQQRERRKEAARRLVELNAKKREEKRRTAASQERMRIISQLARREKKDDNFGMRDEDWDVYKAINKEGGGSDSEEENEKLQELESALRQHSPEFLGDSTTSKPTSLAENYQIELSTEQERLVSNVFLTGGPSSLPGLKPRIERDLLATRPFQSHFSVTMAKVFPDI
ncbi:Actin-related protein 5 [Portunus trituberculatus]|uniref:Actin-related protein 5 n=1 Tax=Portunus trituberculatus TaxID=210409 RepID=A0A5B7D870_PORTR|nr:Actin-related protein 5 [Portunus trituberculatus]